MLTHQHRALKQFIILIEPSAGVTIYYCRLGNFHENFIFANSIKRHISDVKNWQLRHDLPISINDRVILPFREGFIFTKLRSFPKIKSLRKCSNLQYLTLSLLGAVFDVCL